MNDIFALLGQFSITMKEVQNESKEQNERLKSDLKLLVSDAQNTIKKETTKSINETLALQTEAFEKRLKFVVSDIEESFVRMNQERKAIAQQTKLLTWKSIIMFMFGLFIIVGLAIYLVVDAKQKRDIALDELNEIVKNQKLISLEQQVIKTTCGNDVCIKIDPNAPKWGENGEYVIPLFKTQ